MLIQESKVGTCDIRPGRRPTGPDLLAYVAGYRERAGLPPDHHTPMLTRRDEPGSLTMAGRNSLYGPLDPAPDAGYVDAPPRMGFFTDTSVCIGCKACEVACKEWNLVPDDGFNLLGTSYDNTGGLTANSWRHVAFIEQPAATAARHRLPGAFAGMPVGPSASAHTAVVAAHRPDTGTDPGRPAVDALAAAATVTPGSRSSSACRCRTCPAARWTRRAATSAG